MNLNKKIDDIFQLKVDDYPIYGLKKPPLKDLSWLNWLPDFENYILLVIFDKSFIFFSKLILFTRESTIQSYLTTLFEILSNSIIVSFNNSSK
jgi:hypothetical protein